MNPTPTTGIGCCGVPNYGGYRVGRHGASAKVNHFVQAKVSQDLRAGLQFDRGYYHSYNAVPNGAIMASALTSVSFEARPTLSQSASRLCASR